MRQAPKDYYRIDYRRARMKSAGFEDCDQVNLKLDEWHAQLPLKMDPESNQEFLR